MNAADSARLAEVTAETLEKMAFMFAAPAEETPAAEEASLQTAQVDFEGALSGAMELSLSAPALAELAANMLGAEEESSLTAAEQGDALKEFLNVVCGNLLPALFGQKAEFAIAPPRLAAAGCVGWEQPLAVCHLALDNGICRARLRLGGGVPPGLDTQG